MQALLKWYSSLPREVKMMIALAGLGTPMGAIWFLKRYLFPGVATFWIIMGVGAVVAGICVIGLVLKKGFSAGKRRRERKMAAELASDADKAPAAMSERAAVKANTEKFFTAVRDMRKTAGVSVYDLPWYIVIGDSGCGKTRLVNESGLTFSLGKPEGYQLGTLNYNWWFTEEACFIDMAGRLCNPKDDSDQREWQSFLSTIAKGRRGFPINGALVCISAEHLLTDPPEKLEADANVALERLRDLQAKLGVTFATYLVITKCDKILGFVQFFERAAVDITIKNQIFGWSRPGEFNKPYDPEQFDDDFNEVYKRLNELRIRRLSDESDEIEIGYAYTFPEEFREFREPLKTYVRVLFPLIKNPRAVKNLIFRGVYFTSATQEGNLIAKHLAERLGSDAASHLPPIESLFPRKRPHFVKELLLKKVVPEFGLVFRNEQQVQKNRTLARMLQVGSGVMALLLIGLLVWSGMTFSRFIGGPRERAKATLVDSNISPADIAMTKANALGVDVDVVRRGHWSASVLSGFVGTDKPAQYLNTVQVSVFEHKVLLPALRDVETALRETQLPKASGVAAADAAASAYAAALKQYVAWCGAVDAGTFPLDLSGDNFKDFEKLIAVTKADSITRKEGFGELARAYFNAVKQGLGKNPAAMLKSGEFQPLETVKTGVRNVYTFFTGYAILSETNPNIVIREWGRLAAQCGSMMQAYWKMLELAKLKVEDGAAFERFKTDFAGDYGTFKDALEACQWRLTAAQNIDRNEKNFVRITPLRDAIKEQRALWVTYEAELLKAYALGGAKSANDALAGVIRWISVAPEGAPVAGLDRDLAGSLQSHGLATRQHYDAFYSDTDFPQVVREVPESYPYILALDKKAQGVAENDATKLTDEAVFVRDVVMTIATRLLQGGGATAQLALSGYGPPEWTRELDKIINPDPTVATDASSFDFEKLKAEPWRKPQLQALFNSYRSFIDRIDASRLLEVIEKRSAALGAWGYAEFDPGYGTAVTSVYQIPLPAGAAPPPEPTPPPTATPPPVAPPPTPPSDEEGWPGTPSPGSGQPPAAQPAPQPVPAPVVADTGRKIPDAASSRFLGEKARECFELRRRLNRLKTEQYFQTTGTVPRHEQATAAVLGAWDKYCQMFVAAWSQAYAQQTLDDLDKLKLSDWRSFATQFTPQGSGAVKPSAVADQLQASLAEILRATKWATIDPATGQDWVSVRGIGSAFESAMRSQWAPSNGQFVSTALDRREVNSPRPAADDLATKVADRFRALYSAFGQNEKLPRDFRQAVTLSAAPIPWGQVAQMRSDGGLSDEKLSGRLLDFENHAKELLSRELSVILHEVQQATMGSAASGAWPFTGAGLGAVSLEQFVEFLRQVRAVQQAFEPIERDLPDSDPHKLNRKSFYTRCDEWRNFLGLDAAGRPTDLPVRVSVADPLTGARRGNVEDTAPKYYGKVGLNIGLDFPSSAGAGGGDAGELTLASAYATSRLTVDATWRWRVAGAADFRFRLFEPVPRAGCDGMPASVSESLGAGGGAFAFLAYLRSINGGRESDGKWSVVHSINLAQKNVPQPCLPPGGKVNIGIKVIYDLGRNMPDPITPFVRP